MTQETEMKFPQVAVLHWDDPKGPIYFQTDSKFNTKFWELEMFSIIEVHKYSPPTKAHPNPVYLGYKSNSTKLLYSFHPSNLTFLGEL